MARKQSGNMILMLFGAIAVAGVLGTGYMATMKGPGRALSESSRENSIENNMMAATKLVISGDATKQDCDGDGTVEPMAFRTGAGPTGGGLVPLDSGAAKNDPWGKALGYCVWDHGKKSKSDNIATCGGSTANRLQGGNITTENVLAIVSAGKDGIFQTTCNAWVDANTDKIADTSLIVTSGDDIVRKDTMESLLASGTLAQLPILPDSACVAGAEGTMRYENGVPQVCAQTTPTGGGIPTWKEIGGSTGSTAGTFTPVTGVNPSTQQTSNAITIGGFYGTRTATVDGGAILIVNGTPQGSSYEISAGNTVAIRGNSSPSYLTLLTYTLEVGSTSKSWNITTVAPDFTPNAFSFTNLPAVALATISESNIVQITGITGSPATSISGSGASYRVCSDSSCSTVVTPWTTAASTIQNNQYLQLRLLSSPSYNTALTTTMTVGTVSATAWSVTTYDATPNAFSFTNQTNVARSTVIDSNIVQVTGITGSIPISISGAGADYRTCSDAACSSVLTAWTTSAATIQNNQYVQMRLTSSASYETATTATITVGTLSSPSWSVTTLSSLIPSQIVYTASGSWVVPAGATSISAVCVGGGGPSGNGGGRGGDLRYATSLAVTAGETLTITIPVANGGGASAIQRGATVLLAAATGSGASGTSGTSSTIGGNIGGGNGGNGSYGGGGAGGYSGNGGGGATTTHTDGRPGSPGNGGGGGGGGSVFISSPPYVAFPMSAGGGGVGLLGAGASGAGGPAGNNGGGGGSGGTAGYFANVGGDTGGYGGAYGGGAGTLINGGYAVNGKAAGRGACRIIWGTGRAYPSTSTGDV